MDNRNENDIDKNDKSYIDKNINGNKYSNEIKNVNDIIRNKRKKEINIMLLLIKVKTRSIYQINCANQWEVTILFA